MFIIYSCLFQPVSVWWRQYRNHSCSCSRCCCCCHCRRCRLVHVCRCRCCGGRGRGCSRSRCRSLLLSLWLRWRWLCLCLFLFLSLFSFCFCFFFFLLLLLLEVEVGLGAGVEVGVGQVGKGNDISSDAVSSMSVILSSHGLQQKQSIQLYQHTALPTGSASCLKRRTCWHDWYLCCTSEAHDFTAGQILDTWNKSACSASMVTLKGLQGSTEQSEHVSVYLYPHFSGLLRCWLTPPNTTTHPWFCRTLVVSATVWNPRSSSGTTWHVIPTNYIHETKTNRSPSLRVQNIHKL